MSQRKLQKEVEALFKKVHEGIDLFNYYHSRHESSNNDSQREKLEGDLKKEIKKLQKFREQIKGWQSNEAIEAVIPSGKLQEHRRLVEESMEVYKEVEKNSKMKTYSNQSIMLAALENDESVVLSPDAVNAVEFLDECLEKINEQINELDEEYERLSEKKTKRNRDRQVEDRKQEIDMFNQRNHFHVTKIGEVMGYIRKMKIQPDLIWMIQDDLNFYIESNQEPDFVDDDTLYDEIFKEASKKAEEEETSSRESSSPPEAANGDDPDRDEMDQSFVSDASPKPETLHQSQQHSRMVESKKERQEETPRKIASAPSNSNLPSKASTPVMAQTKVYQNVPSSEVASPAIIKTLKPAAAPSNPVGALKWSVAAAAGSNNGVADRISGRSESPEISSNHGAISITHEVSPDDENYKYISVLKNSNLSKAELDLFSDVNLTKVPPGIQDLIISFASARNPTKASKLLDKSRAHHEYSTPLKKPYLPQIVQQVYASPHQLKTPPQWFKLQSYWNKLRANSEFGQLHSKIKLLMSQNNPEHLSFINELTFVYFYGFYYGLTPVENLIAEDYLFQLGWKPYGPRPESAMNSSLEANGHDGQVGSYTHWIKCIKLLSGPQQFEGSPIGTIQEFGDYQVFDLSLWDIYLKLGFKVDTSMLQAEPMIEIG